MMLTKSFRMVFMAIMFLGFPMFANAQERYEAFKQCGRENGLESDAVPNFLKKWEKDEPDNAEMLCSWFQYYLIKGTSQIELIQDIDVDVLEHNAMLPDTLSQFNDLKIKNINILKDNGNGMECFMKALEYINKDIALYPNIFELYPNKIDGLLRKYENKYATAEALKFIHTYRENPDGWFDFYGNKLQKDTLALVFEDNMSGFVNQLLEYNEIELAQILSDSLLAFNPQSLSYRFNVGNCYVKAYQYDKAIEAYKAMLDDTPGEPNALYMLTMLYKEQKDTLNCKKYATLLLNTDDKNMASAAKNVLDGFAHFTIDFEAIETWMKEDNRANFDVLMLRFKQGDQTLMNDELAKLYFGQALTEQVTSTKLTDDQKEINKILKELSDESIEGSFDTAEKLNEHLLKKVEIANKLKPLADKCLESNPVSIAALFYKLMYITVIMENESDVQPYLSQFQMLVNMIRKDADDNMDDGTKVYKILWRADEDVLVDYVLSHDTADGESGKQKKSTYFFSNPVYFMMKEQ